MSRKMSLAVILVVGIFLSASLAAAAEQQVIAGAGPSTKIVQYFFNGFAELPGANGYEVFMAAKDAEPESEVILITAFGYDPNHSIPRASQEGLAAVLMKPFKVRRLLAECHAALGGGEVESA